MRIEKRFPAYGHDIDTDVNPLEAGLGFAIRWDKDFIGRTALERVRNRSPAQRIGSVVLDDADAVPLGHEPVYLRDRIVGNTTSAAFGYRIGRPVALATLDAGRVSEPGERCVEIDIAGARFPGTVTFGSAFDPKGTRIWFQQ